MIIKERKLNVTDRLLMMSIIKKHLIGACAVAIASFSDFLSDSLKTMYISILQKVSDQEHYNHRPKV